VSEGAAIPLRQWDSQQIRELEPATVIGISPDDDLAVLHTSAENPAFAPLGGEAWLGDPLVALGFPKEDNREKFDQFTARHEGQTQFLEASGRAGVESKFKAGQVEPGYSGGPLLNRRTGRVMGVVVASRDRRSDLGGWAIEIPIVAAWLERKGIRLPPVDPKWTDAEAQQRERAGQGATPLPPELIRQIAREVRQTETLAQAQVEKLNRTIQELSDTLGQHQQAIRLALHSLGEQEAAIPDEQLPAKLRESAQTFQHQLEQLAAIQLEDPEVKARFKAAELALQAQDREAADASFKEAAELALSRARAAEELEAKAREVRERGQWEAAEAYVQRGQLAMASLQYAVAAEHFRKAAAIVPASKATERAEYLNRYAEALYRQGDERGDNPALIHAVDAYREALQEYTRERVPLQWATTQNNLGTALSRLGERESGTARLEEAVAAYRAALQERSRERVPLDWATTQTNLGAALLRLGERESGTARLEEAVAAYRAALQERSRERVPLQWAMTQNNLGTALLRLGEREAGTARLEEAVDAYREALQEYTRERVPLQWATTQNNLGTALSRLGEREAGTARLEEAVAAYRAALQERSRERVPLDWAMTQTNLGAALTRLGERESGTARLEEAVAAYRAALQERSRERVPLDWATTQTNLGTALSSLGERESGTARLLEAVEAYRKALEVFRATNATYYVEVVEGNLQQVNRVIQKKRGGWLRRLFGRKHS
jgi:exonuclease VII small subunit